MSTDSNEFVLGVPDRTYGFRYVLEADGAIERVTDGDPTAERHDQISNPGDAVRVEGLAGPTSGDAFRISGQVTSFETHVLERWADGDRSADDPVPEGDLDLQWNGESVSVEELTSQDDGSDDSEEVERLRQRVTELEQQLQSVTAERDAAEARLDRIDSAVESITQALEGNDSVQAAVDTLLDSVGGQDGGAETDGGRKVVHYEEEDPPDGAIRIVGDEDTV